MFVFRDASSIFTRCPAATEDLNLAPNDVGLAIEAHDAPYIWLSSYKPAGRLAMRSRAATSSSIERKVMPRDPLLKGRDVKIERQFRPEWSQG